MRIFFTTRNHCLLLLPVLICMMIILGSCGNTRQLTYLQGKFDTAALSQIKTIDPVVQRGDIVSIIVYSDNQQATALYNQPLMAASSPASTAGGGGSASGAGTGQSGSTGPSPLSSGYLVDNHGDIEFQGLGVLHIEGLSRDGIKELLNSKLKDYLTNPYYSVRFLNHKFTMLGEITKPGAYSIPGESINLLEAVGLAGDMTFYGRRDNILVIRENNGKREFGRLDLTKPEAMLSPYFFLQQNDIVYFEQSRKKVVANDQITARNISLAASIVSTLAIIYSIFRK